MIYTDRCISTKSLTPVEFCLMGFEILRVWSLQQAQIAKEGIAAHVKICRMTS